VRALGIACLLVLAAGPARAAVPPPQPGSTVNIEPTSGRTFYREPGQTRRSPLTTEIQVPVNTIVDATNGRMGVTSANGASDFSKGAFVIREPKGQHVTQLFLAGGRPGTCKQGSHAEIRQLWGDGKGHFQTRGLYAAATVRGTQWLTQDRCDGTFVHVVHGVVAVRDFRLRRTVLVRAGQSYLARA
jgi:hypothetical protein